MRKARIFHDQEKKPTEDRNRHQAFPNEGNLLPQEVCQKNYPGNHAELLNDIP